MSSYHTLEMTVRNFGGDVVAHRVVQQREQSLSEFAYLCQRRYTEVLRDFAWHLSDKSAPDYLDKGRELGVLK